MAALSVIIPARHEVFLKKTVEDLLEHIEGDTDIIVVLDGEWAEPALPTHERLTVLYSPNVIGQRAACNMGAKVSQAKYLMKVDAHCSFDQGFDVKMLEAFKQTGDDVTMVPTMRNLHVFDWVCPDGHRRYQGPTGPCETNGCRKKMTMEMIWRPRRGTRNTSYCFDSTPHFQYFGEYRAKQIGDIVETMSLQGSCFMLTREKWWKLGICDEAFGSWGSQGIEVACKTWLSGGRVLCNRATWYAHCFRTQGRDFGFPYPMSSADQEKAKVYARETFFRNKWALQIHPLSWLVEKFWPVDGWTEADLAKLKEADGMLKT